VASLSPATRLLDVPSLEGGSHSIPNWLGVQHLQNILKIQRTLYTQCSTVTAALRSSVTQVGRHSWDGRCRSSAGRGSGGLDGGGGHGRFKRCRGCVIPPEVHPEVLI
jgi:hypothetical protein